MPAAAEPEEDRNLPPAYQRRRPKAKAKGRPGRPQSEPPLPPPPYPPPHQPPPDGDGASNLPPPDGAQTPVPGAFNLPSTVQFMSTVIELDPPQPLVPPPVQPLVPPPVQPFVPPHVQPPVQPHVQPPVQPSGLPLQSAEPTPSSELPPQAAEPTPVLPLQSAEPTPSSELPPQAAEPPPSSELPAASSSGSGAIEVAEHVCVVCLQSVSPRWLGFCPGCMHGPFHPACLLQSLNAPRS